MSTCCGKTILALQAEIQELEAKNTLLQRQVNNALREIEHLRAERVMMGNSNGKI